MSPPSLFLKFRQIIGRALRETGQALDRAGVKIVSFATTKHEFYDDAVIYEDHLSRHRQYFPLLTAGRPIISPHVSFVAPCATLVGSVQVGKDASIWYGAVLRGDNGENVESHFISSSEIDANDGKQQQPWPLSETRQRDQDDGHGGGIFIGEGTNIQDASVVTARVGHTVIGKGVTVGHCAQIHSATVGDFCLIGMGSVLEEGVEVASETLVAAGAIIPAGTLVGEGELWVGNPARKVRDLTDRERERLHYQSSEYVTVARGQQHVMELGGNVDPTTGASVYLVDQDDDTTKLVDDSTNAEDTPLLQEELLDGDDKFNTSDNDQKSELTFDGEDGKNYAKQGTR